MAAPMKRRLSDDENVCSTEKLSSSISDSIRLTKFLNWANESGIILNEKVAVRKDGSCAQYGMIATGDVKEKELLFQVPRKHLLTPSTCGISNILQAAESDGSLKGTSGWAPLLVSLMYEYNNPESKWRSYMDLVPDFKELDLPMFWPSSERNEHLTGTGVLEAVNKDLGNIEREFTETVLPFINKHPDVFNASCKDLEFYKRMVAFVMAYSFTEDVDEDTDKDLDETNPVKLPPMMVPMADILNHVAKNNASLKFDPEALRMVANRDIKKGEEVFNTYGQLGNSDLLHMYGFSEPFPDNNFDTVEISPEIVFDVAKDIEVNTKELLESKVQFLQDLCLLGEGVNIIIGVGEIMNDDDVITVLKVLLMNETDFNTYVDNEGWEEDLENEAEESLSFDNISKIPEAWKNILCSCAQSRLKQYPSSMAADEEKLKSTGLTGRQRFALNTSYGQKKLLHSLIESCKT